MSDPARRGFRATVTDGARNLPPDQRLAGIAALGVLGSLFLPWWRDPLTGLSYWAVNRFTFIELALMLVAGSVLLMLYGRAEGRGFHLPLADGTLAAGAGVWCCILVLARVLDPPARVLADRTVDYDLRWGFLVTFASGVLLAVAGVRGRRRFHHGQSEALAADVDAETAHAWGETPQSSR